MREFWAHAIAAGVPEHLFWDATPGEVLSVLEKIRERNEQMERLERERAGLIAATMYNAWLRGENERPMKPLDFWASPDDHRMSPAEAVRAMDLWAAQQNAKVH